MPKYRVYLRSDDYTQEEVWADDEFQASEMACRSVGDRTLGRWEALETVLLEEDE